MCLPARIRRDGPAETKAAAGTVDSSESSIESLDEMAAEIQKYLSEKDADDFKKIVNEINTAKDPEQSVVGYVSLDIRNIFFIVYCIKSLSFL